MTNTNDIQIIIDNAGGINLRIDDWYHGFSTDDVTECVSIIQEKQCDYTCEPWTHVIGGHDEELANDWAELEQASSSLSVHDSIELNSGLGGRAGEALRVELAERGVSF